MNKDKLKLVKLLEHWMHHNEEHRKRFADAASEAETIGYKQTAEELMLAAEKSGKVTGHLMKALEHLDGSMVNV